MALPERVPPPANRPFNIDEQQWAPMSAYGVAHEIEPDLLKRKGLLARSRDSQTGGGAVSTLRNGA